ncbi:hypothetical protein [Thalassobacillus sp. C254]|nr:hypothetical protein [Thalassobacillus sp. C254]
MGTIGIIGTGGHAKVITNILEKTLPYSFFLPPTHLF